MGALEEIYTREWFEHDFAELQPEFNVVADSLVREFRLEPSDTVLDVGCGPGMVVRRMRERSISAFGIEGSLYGIRYAHASVQPYLSLADITLQDFLGSPSDLVICTEVAEHLDAEHADHLVKLLCSAMCPIVFTAAPPGQDGHHHVNLQFPSYWEEKFVSHGARRAPYEEANMRDRWKGLKRLSHMRKNVMVFT